MLTIFLTVLALLSTRSWGPRLEPAITSRQSSPPSVVGAVYDESRDRVVAVGRAADTDSFVTTWEWDGARWQVAAVDGPLARVEPMLAYDSRRRRVILYGGDRGSAGPAPDTWSWDGGRWSLLARDGPPPRLSAIVYDKRRDRVVLFGGSRSSDVLLNDVWEFDGMRWTERASGGATPPPRALHGAAYDPRRGLVIAAGFGGFAVGSRAPRLLGDVWSWNGARWAQLDTLGAGARDHVGMVYDDERQALVLHGGGRPGEGLLGDTWRLDDAGWHRLGADGPARGRHRMLYDAKRRRVLLYGGWGPENLTSTEMHTLTADGWMRLTR